MLTVNPTTGGELAKQMQKVVDQDPGLENLEVKMQGTKARQTTNSLFLPTVQK